MLISPLTRAGDFGGCRSWGHWHSGYHNGSSWVTRMRKSMYKVVTDIWRQHWWVDALQSGFFKHPSSSQDFVLGHLIPCGNTVEASLRGVFKYALSGFHRPGKKICVPGSSRKPNGWRCDAEGMWSGAWMDIFLPCMRRKNKSEQRQGRANWFAVSPSREGICKKEREEKKM